MRCYTFCGKFLLYILDSFTAYNFMYLQTFEHVCTVMCFSCYLFFCIMSAYVQLVESEFHINFYVQKFNYYYVRVVLLRDHEDFCACIIHHNVNVKNFNDKIR